MESEYVCYSCGWMFIGSGIFFALLDEKTENQIAEETREAEEKKKEKGPSLLSKILFVSLISDLIDGKKSDKKK